MQACDPASVVSHEVAAALHSDCSSTLAVIPWKRCTLLLWIPRLRRLAWPGRSCKRDYSKQSLPPAPRHKNRAHALPHAPSLFRQHARQAATQQPHAGQRSRNVLRRRACAEPIQAPRTPGSRAAAARRPARRRRPPAPRAASRAAAAPPGRAQALANPGPPARSPRRPPPGTPADGRPPGVAQEIRQSGKHIRQLRGTSWAAAACRSVPTACRTRLHDCCPDNCPNSSSWDPKLWASRS